MTKPSVGRTVHFSPDGGNTIQAAIITRVNQMADDAEATVDLTIFPHDAVPYFKHDCKINIDWQWPRIEGIAGKPSIGAEIVTTVEGLEKKVEHIFAHLFSKNEQPAPNGVSGAVNGRAGDMSKTDTANTQASNAGNGENVLDTKGAPEKGPTDQSASQTA